jgi:hypothetical protein
VDEDKNILFRAAESFVERRELGHRRKRFGIGWFNFTNIFDFIPPPQFFILRLQ